MADGNVAKHGSRRNEGVLAAGTGRVAGRMTAGGGGAVVSVCVSYIH